MKKILTLLLVLVLSLTAFVGCDKIPGLDKLNLPDIKLPDIKLPWEKDPQPETPEEPQPETPEVDADLKAAYDLVHGLTKDLLEATGADYDLVGSVKVKEKNFKVTWTVTDERIVLQTSEDGLTVTVKVPSEPAADIPYTLKFTVANEKGETLSREYEHYVPKFKVNTHEEYLNAKTNTNLVIEGVVVAMNSKSNGNTRNHLFLADTTVVGGYYIYQMDVDPVTAGIEVGMTVRVTGPASPYSGMQEIKGGVPEIIDTNKKTVDPTDITNAFAAGEDLAKYVGLVVTVKNVTIGGQELGGTSDYLFFSIGQREAYVRSYKTDFPTTLPMTSKEAIEAAHNEHFLWTANATGILVLYSGNPYLIPVSETPFEFLEAPQLTSEEKVDLTLETITLPGDITTDTTLELPLTGKNYSEVTITWTVDSTDFNIGEDGKMPITLGATEVTLKLTATATYDGVAKSKEFTVKVSANLVMNEKHSYVASLVQGTLGQTLYLDGGVSTRYLTTTTDPAAAVAVYAEKAVGGYKLYILGEDGGKLYITMYKNADGKDSVNYDANGTTVYTYNKTVNAWVSVLDGVEKYLGTYKDFNTVSISNLTYINADNTGVSQFPLEILPVAEGTPFNMFVNQATLAQTLYLDGGVDTRYLTTTTDAAAAKAVYAERVDGGYKFYILGEDDGKLYITMYKNAEGKDSVNYDANGTTVYTYNPTVNAWVSVLDGVEKYLGTYKNFNTISVSNLTYINAENTGVSQFPLDIAAPAEAPACDHTNTNTTTVDPTCTENGSTTVVCADCGETLSTTTTNALGHSWNDATCTAPKTCGTCGATEGEAAGHTYGEDGTCTVCGTSQDHVCEFTAEKTVDPTCTEAGYTVYACTCGKTENRDPVEATGHTEETTTIEATCSAEGSTVVTCAVCKETLSTTTIQKLPHADNNGDFKCDTCSAVVEPADGTVLTLAQAQALAKLFAHDTYTTNKFKVVVTVKEVYNTTYGNMYVTDATLDSFTVYGTYSADGSTRYDALPTKPVQYDTVTLYGKIGTYNSAAQMKNAQIVEHTVHTHDFVAGEAVAPSCTSEGYTPYTCSCGSVEKRDTVDALGHTTDSGECTRCGKMQGGEKVVEKLATFTFGDNGATGHVDGKDMPSGTNYTDGDYTLTFQNCSKVYKEAKDETGTSAIKLGTSSATGTFTFTVDENVTKVTIYVAMYKAKTTKVTINGTTYSITTSSNNGEYTAIEIDTTNVKEITFATVSGSARCMIDAIEFYGYAK